MTFTSDLVSRIGIESDPYYSKFGVWMHLRMAKCCIAVYGLCDLDLWAIFRIIMFGAFFSILFELGIPNLVCGCFLGWQSVMYQFCDLDLILYNNRVRSKSHILLEGGIPNLLYGYIFGC